MSFYIITLEYHKVGTLKCISYLLPGLSYHLNQVSQGLGNHLHVDREIVLQIFRKLQALLNYYLGQKML